MSFSESALDDVACSDEADEALLEDELLDELLAAAELLVADEAASDEADIDSACCSDEEDELLLELPERAA